MNIQNASFCMKTANDCANNLAACFNKAEKVLETTRREQLKAVERYNKHMNKFKADITAAFDQANKRMKQAMVDAMLQVGSLYKTPIGLDMSLMNDKLLAGVNPALKMEDPAKYAAVMKQNIQKVITQVEKNNREILNGTPGSPGSRLNASVQKYTSNYREQQGTWEGIAQRCLSLIQNFNKQQQKMAEKQNEQRQEQFEETREICSRIDAYNRNEIPSCDGEAGELADDMLKAVALAGERNAIGVLQQHESICNSQEMVEIDFYNRLHQVTTMKQWTFLSMFFVKKMENLMNRNLQENVLLMQIVELKTRINVTLGL